MRRLLLTIYLLLEFKFLITKTALKIGAPEFMCNANSSDSNATSDPSNQFTKIRLASVFDENVKYEWKVTFRILTPKDQRSTLILWRRVRELQQTLQKNITEIFSEGLFNLNNSMLTDGVYYNFELISTQPDGTSTSKAFQIEYVNNPAGRALAATQDLKVSLVLNSPSIIYTDLPLIAFVEVIKCDEIPPYQIKWTVLDPDEKTIHEETGELTSLKVPAFLLKPAESYRMVCSLIKSEDNEVLASKFAYVDCLAKPPLLTLNASDLMIGQNDSMLIHANLIDFLSPENQLNENYSFQWVLLQNNLDKSMFDISAEKSQNLKLNGADLSAGEYTLKVTAMDAKAAKICEASMVITALETPEVPRVNVNLPSDYSIEYLNPNNSLTIQSTIYGAFPGCEIKWLCVEREGCLCVNLRTLPRELGKPKRINSIENTFLNDISDFSDGVSTRIDYDLNIPPFEDPWPGLARDSCYLFQLNIACSTDNLRDILTQHENQNDMIGNSTSVSSVNGTEFSDTEGTVSGANSESILADLVFFANVLVKTNAAPKLVNLTVDPTSGEMGKTKFFIRSNQGVDLESDQPILYQFFISPDRETKTVLGEQYEVSNLETVAPISGDVYFGMSACDIWNNCDEIYSDIIVVK